MASPSQEFSMVPDDGVACRSNVWTRNKCVTYEDGRPVFVEGVHDAEPPVSRPAERSRKDQFKDTLQAPLYAFGRVFDDTKTILGKSPAGNLTRRSEDLKGHSKHADPTADDEERASRKSRDLSTEFDSKTVLMRSRSMISIRKNWSKRKSQAVIRGSRSRNSNRSNVIWSFSKRIDRYDREMLPEAQTALEPKQQGEDGTLEEKEDSSKKAVLGNEDTVEHKHEVQIRGKLTQHSRDRMDEDKEAMAIAIPNNSSPTKHKIPLTKAFLAFDLHKAPPEEHLERVCSCEDHQNENYNVDPVCRHFWAQPEAFGYNIEGHDPANDNPYLHWDRQQEIQEWTATTEEYVPEHVYALPTAELKHLHGAAVKFDVVHTKTTYKKPANTPAAYSSSNSESGEETLIDDEEPQYKHKDLAKLLGVPNSQNDLKELQQVDKNTHIVADWEPYGFDLDVNYSDYYGVPLFDPPPDTWLKTPDDEDVELEDKESGIESSGVESEQAKEEEQLNAWRSWGNTEGEDPRVQSEEGYEEDGYSLFETRAYEEQLSQESSTAFENGHGERSSFHEREHYISSGTRSTEQNVQDYAEQYNSPEGESWSHHEYTTPERYSNGHERYTETAGTISDDCTSLTIMEEDSNHEAFDTLLHNVILPRIHARQRREREDMFPPISVSSEDLESIAGSYASYESIAGNDSMASAVPYDQSETLRPETWASVRSTSSSPPSFTRSVFPQHSQDESEPASINSRSLQNAVKNPSIKITEPRSNTLTSTSSTTSSSSSLTRTHPAHAQVPAQSLILHLRGRGLSVRTIAIQISALSAEFLYDSNSRWFNGLRIPEHPSFDESMVDRIMETCEAGMQWWEGECDDEGKPLPEGFRVLQRRMRISKAEKFVKKCLENYFYWRFSRTVLHPTLMRG
jgi:hypothetical protein